MYRCSESERRLWKEEKKKKEKAKHQKEIRERERERESKKNERGSSCGSYSAPTELQSAITFFFFFLLSFLFYSYTILYIPATGSFRTKRKEMRAKWARKREREREKGKNSAMKRNYSKKEKENPEHSLIEERMEWHALHAVVKRRIWKKNRKMKGSERDIWVSGRKWDPRILCVGGSGPVVHRWCFRIVRIPDVILKRKNFVHALVYHPSCQYYASISIGTRIVSIQLWTIWNRKNFVLDSNLFLSWSFPSWKNIWSNIVLIIYCKKFQCEN